jgi:hypothetical protein
MEIYLFCQSKENEVAVTLQHATGSASLLEEPEKILADTILGGNAGEVTKKDSVDAAVIGEKRSVKNEEKEELKRQKIIRVREQFATVKEESPEITRLIFSEVNDGDVTLRGGQGFSFDAKERHYYKLVKNAGVTDRLGYEDVVRMMGIPVSKTPDGTPSSSPEKRTPPAGRKYVELFAPGTKYNLKEHSMDTWSVFGDNPKAHTSKLVR